VVVLCFVSQYLHCSSVVCLRFDVIMGGFL
jgi:hypothetical protein